MEKHVSLPAVAIVVVLLFLLNYWWSRNESHQVEAPANIHDVTPAPEHGEPTPEHEEVDDGSGH